MARILIIDDNSDLRTIMQHLLEAEGHQVALAADGQEGLAEQCNVPAELIITDIFMPNKEGLETIRELRMEHPHTPIIAMSGGGRLSGDNYLQTAQELGAMAILRKPFDMAALLECVKTALQTSRG